MLPAHPASFDTPLVSAHQNNTVQSPFQSIPGSALSDPPNPLSSLAAPTPHAPPLFNPPLPASRATLRPLDRECQVLNRDGIHARPAAAFVRCAREFTSQIEIIRGPNHYSAKSILEILSANLNRGCTFTLRAEGPDASQALERIHRLLDQLAAEDP